MIDFHFRAINGQYYPQFKLQNLNNALDAVLFVLEDLDLSQDWCLAIGSDCNTAEKIPNMHLQKVGDGIFLQVFINEEYSPDGNEGWFTLLGNQEALDRPPFCLIDDLHDERNLYFEAGFSQGVAFSRKFVADKKVVIDRLKYFASTDQSKWIDGEYWLNLGLI